MVGVVEPTAKPSKVGKETRVVVEFSHPLIVLIELNLWGYGIPIIDEGEGVKRQGAQWQRDAILIQSKSFIGKIDSQSIIVFEAYLTIALSVWS